MRMSCSMAQLARAPDEARGPRRSLRRFSLGLAIARELERLHSLNFWRPEGDLLAVLPLDRHARGLADAPDGVVGLEGLHERDRLRRHLHFRVGVERRDVIALAGRRLPEAVLLPLHVDAERDGLHVPLAHLPPDDDPDRA